MRFSQYVWSIQSTFTHQFNRHHKTRTFFRILFWKINQWFFHMPAIVTLEGGIRCICYPDSSYGSMIVYNRLAEYDVMQNILANLSSQSIYIDVGANIGDTTVIAASKTRGKIFAFEPSPVAYPRLLENIRLNNVENQVTAEQVVLTNASGKVSFVEMATSETSHIRTVKKEGKEVMLRAVTLDRYAKLHDLKQIDLVKIDVEGAEMLVLQGAAKLLARHRIKCLLIELNSEGQNYGYSNTDVIEYLRQFGYVVPPIADHSEVNGKIINVQVYAPK